MPYISLSALYKFKLKQKLSGVKKTAAFVAAAVFLVFILPALSVSSESGGFSGNNPEITSGNLVVVRSVDTGQVLLDTSDGGRIQPTATAKLVSAMVIYDSISSLDEVVTVPPEAALAKNIGAYGDISSPMLGLTPGGSFTAKQLLTATLVSSANDACFTLAYFVSEGNIAAFVEKMNQKAQSLGCQDTLYTSPVGLSDINSYTTPVDASVIAAAFYRYNTLLDISSLPSYVIGNVIHTKNYLLSNTLLSGYTISGAKGMIVGQARSDGGYCLITSAEKSGLSYVFVVMESPGEIRNKDGTRQFPDNNAYDDIKKVFDWALSSFSYLTLVEDREIIGELPVTIAAGNVDHISYAAEKEVDILMPVGALREDVERDIMVYYDSLEAPVEKDMLVGRMDLYYGDVKIATVSLVTNGEVERSNLLSLSSKFKSLLESPAVKTAVKAVIIIIVIYFILVVASQVYRAVSKANAYAKKRELNPRPPRKSGGKAKSPAKNKKAQNLPPGGERKQANNINKSKRKNE